MSDLNSSSGEFNNKKESSERSQSEASHSQEHSAPKEATSSEDSKSNEEEGSYAEVKESGDEKKASQKEADESVEDEREESGEPGSGDSEEAEEELDYVEKKSDVTVEVAALIEPVPIDDEDDEEDQHMSVPPAAPEVEEDFGDEDGLDHFHVPTHHEDPLDQDVDMHDPHIVEPEIPAIPEIVVECEDLPMADLVDEPARVAS